MPAAPAEHSHACCSAYRRLISSSDASVARACGSFVASTAVELITLWLQHSRRYAASIYSVCVSVQACSLRPRGRRVMQTRAMRRRQKREVRRRKTRRSPSLRSWYGAVCSSSVTPFLLVSGPHILPAVVLHSTVGAHCAIFVMLGGCHSVFAGNAPRV